MLLKIAIGLGVVLLVFILLVVVLFLLRPKPRPQHYFFAHNLLPTGFLTNPVGIIMPLMGSITDPSKSDGPNLLRDLWEAQLEGSTEQPIPWDFTYTMTVIDHPNNTVALVTLPTPEKKPEAYFVAMVFDGPGMAAGNIRQLRYFTLEFMGMKGDVPQTLFSEWTLKGEDNLKYTSYEDNIEPTHEAFLAQIRTKLPESLPVPGAA